MTITMTTTMRVTTTTSPQLQRSGGGGGWRERRNDPTLRRRRESGGDGNGGVSGGDEAVYIMSRGMRNGVWFVEIVGSRGEYETACGNREGAWLRRRHRRL